MPHAGGTRAKREDNATKHYSVSHLCDVFANLPIRSPSMSQPCPTVPEVHDLIGSIRCTMAEVASPSTAVRNSSSVISRRDGEGVGSGVWVGKSDSFR